MRTLTEERRDAIIDAGLALFQEMGYERTSMNEVAKRVGGSKATLYNYFSSKEELFETVVRRYSTLFLTEAAAELQDTGPGKLTLEEKLTRFGEKMLSVLTSENQAMQIYRCVISEAGHSDIGRLFFESGPKESMEKLSELFAEAMNNGELAPANPMLRASQFTSLIKAETEVMLFSREVPRCTDEQIRQMVKNGVSLFMKGAATH